MQHNNQHGPSEGESVNETGEFRESWKIFRIMSEFVEGYQFLGSLKNEVTVLGSARTPEDDPYYVIAKTLGGLLAKEGYTTLTGGGPGIMTASNKGAFEGGGESVGLNIQLPFEQRINPYVQKSTAFYYFFTRKVMLTSPAHAFVFFPGGFGTMDEFFEVVDHIEIGKMCRVPIILVGKDFWTPLLAFLKESGCAVGSVRTEQIDRWYVVDTAEEALEVISSHRDDEEKHSCELSPMNFHSKQYSMDWRVFRIMAELVEGFEFLTGLIEDVTVLGTKSLSKDSPYYSDAYTLGQMLAGKKYTTVTGGAGGIAEAANKGAMESGGASYGIGMTVNGKERLNAYVTKSIMFQFPFTRKLIITAPSKAFVFFPGGFGTLHHLFEVLTLIETGKMQRIPVILYNHAYWEPLHVFIKKLLVHEYATVSDEDDELYQIVDSPEAVMKIIEEFRK